MDVCALWVKKTEQGLDLKKKKKDEIQPQIPKNHFK